MTSDYVVVPREILPEMSEAAAKALNKAMAGDEAGWAYMQAEAEAAYAGALSVAPSPWRPISNYAGRDYDGVLLHSEEWFNFGEMLVGWRIGGVWVVEGIGIEDQQPTHFMPLPAPPSNPT